MKRGQLDLSGNCICEECRNEFHIWPSRVRMGKGRFCSRECLKKASAYEVRECSTCHREIRKLLSIWKQQDKRRKNQSSFCSVTCASSWRSKNIRGEKTSFWKGGATSTNKLARINAAYKLWRRLVFERDDYTCQMCGVQGGFLHADHIESFSAFPELRYIIGNGRTLCRGCHFFITVGRQMPENSRWGLYHQNFRPNHEESEVTE